MLEQDKGNSRVRVAIASSSASMNEITEGTNEVNRAVHEIRELTRNNQEKVGEATLISERFKTG